MKVAVLMQGPQTALLGPLKEVLESMTGGYEVMKEVVAALQDTERGKTASMTVLLQELQERQAGKPSREEQERLRQEVRSYGVDKFWWSSNKSIDCQHQDCMAHSNCDTSTNALHSLDCTTYATWPHIYTAASMLVGDLLEGVRVEYVSYACRMV